MAKPYWKEKKARRNRARELADRIAYMARQENNPADLYAIAQSISSNSELIDKALAILENENAKKSKESESPSKSDSSTTI